jgi:putative ABC transport system permease protein
VRLAFRLALRDLRGGLAGLRLLAVCLFLGVLALAGVGSLSAAIVAGLAEQGQSILGGDVQVSLNQRRATAEELDAFRAAGEVSQVVRMRAMAARADGGESLLVELKGVDAAYPLFGALDFSAGTRPRGLEVALAPELAERLGAGIGDRLRIGMATLRVSGLIAHEPDRVGQGFTLGPTAIVDHEGLTATRLVQPGSLYSAAYRIRLNPGLSPESVREDLEARFPEAGLRIQDRSNGAPGVRRFTERVGQFLTLVGLASLLIAGVGVGSGVSSHLDRKRAAIATLKLLGADAGTIFRAYLLQIGIVAIGAILVGMAVGAMVPAIVLWLAGDALPAPPRLSVYPWPLLASAAYGLLIAAMFALVPLARARGVPPASLFRADLEPARRPSGLILAAVTLATMAIAALALSTARAPGGAAMFLGAASGLLILLGFFGWLVRRLASAAPRPRHPVLRIALANLHRPGAQTGRLVIALGLGFTLFTALAVIETNLAGQIRTTIPRTAPSFFMLDIPAAESGRFRALADEAAPDAGLVMVPNVRGSVMAIAGQRVADMDEIPEGAWFLRGDRGLTYLAELPHGNHIVEGAWWSPDYDGPPLVSLDVEAARAVGLAVGDPMTLSVAGREIEARIASLREINWDTMGFNFVIIMSPGALEGAPHSMMATLSLPAAAEAGFQRRVTAAFPTVSLIRVKEVVQTFSDMLGQLGVAIRAAASVAILAGIAVLIGALAASRRARIYDSVLL